MAATAARGRSSARARARHVSTGWFSTAMRAAKRMKRSSESMCGQAATTASASTRPWKASSARDVRRASSPLLVRTSTGSVDSDPA